MSIDRSDDRHLSAIAIMNAAYKAEAELEQKLYISRQSLYMLINALSGVASCGTNCGSCKMSNQSANEVLEKFAHSTGITREMAYSK